MIPLQIPGLPELLIFTLGFVLQLAVPALVALVVYQFMDGRNAYEERIAVLEDEVSRLEADVERLRED